MLVHCQVVAPAMSNFLETSKCGYVMCVYIYIYVNNIFSLDLLLMQDCGQPGFTISERKRFGAILKEYVIF